MLKLMVLVAGLLALGSLTGSILLFIQQKLAQQFGYVAVTKDPEVFRAHIVAIVAVVLATVMLCLVQG